MSTGRERKVGLSLAGAGIGVIGVAIVFGLTTDSGDLDWVGIITAFFGGPFFLFLLYRDGAKKLAL